MATLAFALWSAFAIGAAENEQSWLVTGDCTLALDPASSKARLRQPLVACLKGRGGAEVTVLSGAPRENYWVRHASGSLSLHMADHVALMTRGLVRDVVELGDEAIVVDRRRETDYAILQVGNPALHRVWLSIGKQRLPFGLDLSNAVESYKRFETRSFWDSPDHAAAVSIDDLRSLRFDFGYGTSEFGPTREPLKAPVHAASARIMYDIAALDGSRLVASGYGESRGSRRFGLGIVSVSRKGDETSTEFVRLQSTLDGRTEPFRQLLRFGYAGFWRKNARWVVQIDDERFRMRMGMLAYDLRLTRYATVRFAVAHYKSEAGDNFRRWLTTSGLEVQL